jgi:hypothetical protein
MDAKNVGSRDCTRKMMMVGIRIIKEVKSGDL